LSRPARLRLLVLAAVVGAVEVLCRLQVIPAFTMIAPSAMVAALPRVLAGGRMTAAIAGTLRNVGLAIAASVLVGFAAGALVHALPRVRRTLDPLLATYYAIPIYAFYPLLIVLFGLGDVPQIAVGFLLGVVAMVVATLDGFDRIPAVLVKTARVHRMGRLRTAWRIRLPAALPHLFTGVKLAVAYAFIGVIGAEFIMSGSGIGYEIAFAYNNFDNRVMYPLIVLVLLLVTAVNLGLHAWEDRLFQRRRRR
jgi:NitT/TauT family transport system permease protein